MTTARPEGSTSQCLLDNEIDSFIESLRAARYAEETVHRKRAIAREFAQWAQQYLIVAGNLNSDSVAQFITRLPERAKTRVALERATVRLFLRHLDTRGCLKHPSPKEIGSGHDSYLRRYEDYLRKDCGLTGNSVHVYVPFIRDFVGKQNHAGRASLSHDAFDTLKVQSFLLAQTKDRSGEYKRLLATSLRSFFRFLFFTGEATRDFSVAFLWSGNTGCRHHRHFLFS